MFVENSEIIFMMKARDGILGGVTNIPEKIHFKRFGRFPENCSIECNTWNRSATWPWLISHLLSLEMPYAQLFRPTFQEKTSTWTAGVRVIKLCSGMSEKVWVQQDGKDVELKRWQISSCRTYKNRKEVGPPADKTLHKYDNMYWFMQRN